MPGYIKKVLAKYLHDKPARPQHAPYPAAPRKYEAAAQAPMDIDDSPAATPEEITRIQGIVGSILYYAGCVDLAVRAVLSTIAAEQAKATKNTIKNTNQLLDYLATHPGATIRFHASDMILNIHSDASYVSVKGAKIVKELVSIFDSVFCGFACSAAIVERAARTVRSTQQA